MKLVKRLNLWFAAALFPASGLLAQTNTNQELFLIRFQATCLGLDTNTMRLANSSITERTIIAESLGFTNLAPAVLINSGNTNELAGYGLVYRPGADKVQVMNLASGVVLGDVLGFAGGASVSDERRRSRLTFVFVPSQGTAVGSAIIDQFAPGATGAANAAGGFVGRFQFVLTHGEALGHTNLIDGLSTNNVSARIGPAVFPPVATHFPPLTDGATALTATSGLDTGTGIAPPPPLIAAAGTTPTGRGITGSPLSASPAGGFPVGIATNGLPPILSDDPTAQICSGFFITTTRIR